jgi:RNA polymerase sigma-70 factor (sigma-E family)
MDPGHPVEALEDLLAAKGEHLRRTATLLAGSPQEGEDLLQAALEKAFRRWRSIRGDPEGYLRRTLYNLAADGWRRRQAWRAKVPLLGHPTATPDETVAVDDRDHLIRLLRDLPPRQRTAIVLRYWEDLPDEEAARAMGCSPSTVRSAASRGLARLRELSANPDSSASPGGTANPDGSASHNASTNPTSTTTARNAP